jgi:hypothetical protein
MTAGFGMPEGDHLDALGCWLPQKMAELMLDHGIIEPSTTGKCVQHYITDCGSDLLG